MPAPAASARRHRGWWMLSLLAFVWPWGLAGEGVPFFFEADSCGVVVGRECGVVWASRSMFISCVRLLFCLILVFLSFYVDIRYRSPEDTPPLLLHVGILPSQSLIGGYKWGEGGGGSDRHCLLSHDRHRRHRHHHCFHRRFHGPPRSLLTP